MSLHADLLTQAKQLVRQEPRRPRQASLRRAISTAYYALFHLLTDEGTRRAVPGGDAELRALVARSFDHGEMKIASNAFSSGWGGLPPALRTSLPNPLPPDLILVAATFFTLQQARHEADYNLARRFTRKDADRLVTSVEEAFEAWERVRGTEAGRVYLLSLMFWRRWGR